MRIVLHPTPCKSRSLLVYGAPNASIVLRGFIIHFLIRQTVMSFLFDVASEKFWVLLFDIQGGNIPLGYVVYLFITFIDCIKRNFILCDHEAMAKKSFNLLISSFINFFRKKLN